MIKNRIISSNSIDQVLRTIAQLLYTSDQSDRSSFFYYETQARMIIEHITQRSVLYQLHDCLAEEHYKELELVLEQYIERNKPLAYCFGNVEFLSLNLAIKPPILIPRPETEAWVAHYIKRYEYAHLIPSSILDMCTGCGPIALALAHAFTKSKVIGIDNNPQALALANTNKQRYKINNVSFIQSDLYNELDNTFKVDVIVSNPPYLSLTEWRNLEPSVKEWEDPHALYAAQNGLELIKKIITHAPYYLSSRCYSLYKQKSLPNIVVEIGHSQGQVIQELLSNSDALNIKVHKDIGGNDRYVEALLKPMDSL